MPSRRKCAGSASGKLISRGWPAGHPERTDRAKAVVNEVMRRGLKTGEKPVPDREPFKVESVRCGLLPGFDPLKLNQLVDELEVDGFLERLHGCGGDSS